MTIRDLLTAAGLGLGLLLVLAALAFGAVWASAANSDRAHIENVLRTMPPQDAGVPDVNVRIHGFREGYFPECEALSILLREHIWWRTINAAIRADALTPTTYDAACLNLRQALVDEDSVSWFTYARYWHGALILPRAVLSVADYGALKTAVAGLVIAGLLAFCAALTWRLGWPVALIVTAASALLTDAAAVPALPVQATSLAVLMLAAAGFIALAAGWRRWGALVAAMGAGALYCFFDFFFNPEILAALCAWGWLAVGETSGVPRRARDGAVVFAAVLGGYAGFWMLKWAIGGLYALNGGDIYLFNTDDFTRWAPGAQTVVPGAAIAAAVAATFDLWWKLAIALGLVLVTAILAMRNSAGRRSGRALATLLTPIGLGLLVLEAVPLHTVAHVAVTFRMVPFGLGMVLASALIALPQITPAARKPAIEAAS